MEDAVDLTADSGSEGSAGSPSSSGPESGAPVEGVREAEEVAPVDAQPGQAASVQGPPPAGSSEIPPQPSGSSEAAAPPVSEGGPPVPQGPQEGQKTVEEPLVAPEEELIQTRSRIVHVLLSLLVVLLVVGGAASAAYWYSKSGSTALRLPKLPFVEEPQSVEELLVPSQEPAGSEEAPAEETSPSGEVPSPPTKPEESSPRQAPQVPAGSTTKGGLSEPEIDESWETFRSSSWGYSFRYPKDWYLYPRDTGSLGEATMVAQSPLPALDNDLRRLSIQATDLAVGVGVLAEDKAESQSLVDYISAREALYGVSRPVVTKVGERSFVKAPSLEGNVINYYLSQGSRIYFISVKPANYAAQYREVVEKIILSFSVS